MGPGAVTDLPAMLAALTREVADFPKPGVVFRDLIPVFADRDAMTAITDALTEVAQGADLVAGIDARGLLLAAAVAVRLGTGVLAIRKGGKLPPPVLSENYQREYGAATLEIPADGIALEGRRVVIIDDVLATGGSVGAAQRLLEHSGASVTSAAVVVELVELAGREALTPLSVHSLSRV